MLFDPSTRLLYSVGNLGQRPYGVLVAHDFDRTEVYGAFSSELQAANWLDAYLQFTFEQGGHVKAAVVALQCDARRTPRDSSEFAAVHESVAKRAEALR